MTGSPEALHGYHAHIYYNDETFPIATKLRDTLATDFPVQIGRNAGIAGPHPVPQIQIIFKKDAFQSVVPWLMLNREGLDILVHPLSDDEDRRPHHQCIVAWYAGRTEDRDTAARPLPRPAAADRLNVRAAEGDPR